MMKDNHEQHEKHEKKLMIVKSAVRELLEMKGMVG